MSCVVSSVVLLGLVVQYGERTSRLARAASDCNRTDRAGTESPF
jgi:hypothetical protein